MLRKLLNLMWVLKTFKNPILFLQTLYRNGTGTVLLHMREGLEIEVRRNRWDSAIVMEMFDNCPYLSGVDLGAQSIVVDIGCYIGDFALLVARRHGARVVAFEPSPDNFSIAQSNIRRNRLDNRIELHNLAIGDGQPITLYVRRDGGETHVTFEPVSGAIAERVNSVSLHDALSMANGDIDLLKVDCEGFEYSIIEAVAPSDLAKVRAIALEYHYIEGWDEKLKGLRAKLDQAGFEVTDKAPYLFGKQRAKEGQR